MVRADVDHPRTGGQRRGLAIIVGQTATLPNRDFGVFWQPMNKRVNPLRGKTTNWRAGCGRTARPVRREGELVLSLPYHASKHGRDARDSANMGETLMPRLRNHHQIIAVYQFFVRHDAENITDLPGTFAGDGFGIDGGIITQSASKLVIFPVP